MARTKVRIDKDILLKRINEHKLAVAVANEEGGKAEANIAEIAQIVNITLEILSGFSKTAILELVHRHRK